MPTFELVDEGYRWAAVRDGDYLLGTWDRAVDPTTPHVGILAQLAAMMEWTRGVVPTWVETDRGWRAA